MPSSVLSAPRLQTEDRFSAVVEQAEVAARNYDTYQEWALKTYGDSAKTKTVTRKKYSRIVKILRGEESSSMENSKFRFWVKAKGFRLGLNDADSSTGGEILYVPASKLTSASGSNCPSPSQASGKDATKDPLCQYKRVAVVENFYDIIYNVHVEMDGRSGRHAGQKRTYRAVAEMYAFLPREAVTRFLMSCSDCQKRMHLQYNNSPASTPFSVLNNKSSITSSLNVTSATCANTTSTNTATANNNNNSGGSSNSNSRDANEIAPTRGSNANGGGDESGQEEEDEEEEAMEEDELDCTTGPTLAGAAADGQSPSPSSSSEKVNSNCRVLVDCRLNPVVDVENEICPGINTEGIRSLRHQTGTTHTRQHPDQAISKRTNGPSNKRKVASRSSCAPTSSSTSTSTGSTCSSSTNASAESSSIPKRIRTSQDHHHHHGHHCQQLVPSRHAMEGGEEDTEDRSDNLVVVAFDEANSSNGSLDEVTGDTHPIDATSATGGSSSFNLATGPGSKKSSKLHMNHESSRENENSNSQTGDIQSVNKKGTTGKGVESEVEAKLRTRERLLAALTSLNGVAGVGRCKQNSSTSNNTTSSNGNTSTIGNSCNSPQPLSPSVSDICTKDEEEDEEDDEEGEGLLAMHAKDANGDFDPERLKAFNMFVRLFVDENLDRMVPISRQPKDKIQAIIDSCHRQFPEFTERARKRIRTYLKSCRRTRRHKSAVSCDSLGTKEVNFGDQLVQQQPNSNQQQFINSSGGSGGKNSTTGQSNGSSGQVVSFTSSGNSYHMTSSLAEQILATACDNEYQNAKRMRLGLKPLAVDYEDLEMASCFTSASSIGTSGAAVQVLRPKNSAHTSSSLLAALCQQQQQQQQQLQHQQSESESFLDSGTHQNQSQVVVDGEAVNATDSLVNNSSATTTTTTTTSTSGSNGLASDFTTCKSIRPQAGSTSGHHHYSLNPTEAAMVRQLISGYRESAAFLLRSADELEQLLLRQV